MAAISDAVFGCARRNSCSCVVFFCLSLFVVPLRAHTHSTQHTHTQIKHAGRCTSTRVRVRSVSELLWRWRIYIYYGIVVVTSTIECTIIAPPQFTTNFLFQSSTRNFSIRLPPNSRKTTLPRSGKHALFSLVNVCTKPLLFFTIMHDACVR